VEANRRLDESAAVNPCKYRRRKGGTDNPKTRQLRINAKPLDGNVIGGKYLVSLSEDNKSLEKGRWSESGDGGGSWSGKKWDKKSNKLISPGLKERR
jgi:hypothetical protein